MRLIVSAVLVMIFTGLAPAAESGGLTGALERQRLDLSTQQSEIRREIERQSGSLQRQQEQIEALTELVTRMQRDSERE